MFIPFASRNIKNNECAITYEEMWCIIIIYITLEMHMHGAVNRKWYVQHDCWGQRGVEGCGWDHVCVPIAQVIHGDTREQTGVWVTPLPHQALFLCARLSVYVWNSVRQCVFKGGCVCACVRVCMCESNLSGTETTTARKVTFTSTAGKILKLPLDGDFHNR